MLIALDTNVVAYAGGVMTAPDDDRKVDQAQRIMDAVSKYDVVVPIQVLGEYHRVLTRKARCPASDARARLDALLLRFRCPVTSETAFRAGIELAASHKLQIWDAIILAVAAENGCILLLSEDFQDGFTWNGVSIANPFADPLHPALSDLLSRPPSI